MSTPMELTPGYFFDLDGFSHAPLFKPDGFVWETLRIIKDYCQSYTGYGELEHYSKCIFLKGSKIAIGEGTIIEEGAYIAEPAIIGRNCVIRQGAYLRGNVVTGDNVIIGHATEVKNSVFLDGAKAPHFNYVGDSILGRKVNIGAGTKLSNVKILDTPIRIWFNEQGYETGLRKFGAILGDNSQTGCNSVLNPSCMLGRDSLVYPNVTATGFYATGSVIKPGVQPRVITRRSV